MATTLSWVDECTCCCGDEQVHTEYENNNMKCCTCGCYKPRPKGDAAGTPISVRLVLRGSLTLRLIEKANVLARELGADDDVILRKMTGHEHFIDVPADGLLSKIEISALTASKN